MAVLGPAVFYAHWPYLWHHPVDRTAWYLNFHLTHNHYAWFYLGESLRGAAPSRSSYGGETALTVPTAIFAAMSAGFVWVCARACRSARFGFEFIVAGRTR